MPGGLPASKSQFHIGVCDCGQLRTAAFLFSSLREFGSVVVRSAKKTYYKYVNGQSIKYAVKPTLGTTQRNNPKDSLYLNFDVTPHLLRHTYITNLCSMRALTLRQFSTWQEHENSKTTMDIYAVQYNKPEELFEVVNDALNKEFR